MLENRRADGRAGSVAAGTASGDLQETPLSELSLPKQHRRLDHVREYFIQSITAGMQTGVRYSSVTAGASGLLSREARASTRCESDRARDPAQRLGFLRAAGHRQGSPWMKATLAM